MARDFGGAFDVDPQAYWTREDVDEVASAIEDTFTEKGMKVFVTSSYINYDKKSDKDIFDIEYHLEAKSGEHYYGSLLRRIAIDFRRAKTTEQLVKVYVPEIVEALIAEMSLLNIDRS
jgi:hypothetical protein